MYDYKEIKKMKLYYSKGACSLVVRITLNELGVVFETESVDLKTKKTETGKNFLSINPKGAVPTLVLDEGEVLTENAVILQYLADTSENGTMLLPEVGSLERYRVLEWLNFATTELHKTFGVLFNADVPQEIKDRIFIPLIKKKFKYISQSLGNRKYIAADHFTLPDAYLFVMMRWALFMKIDFKECSNLAKYFNELSDRKSIKESLKQES
jgi:glutathione S-transferase